MADTQGLLRVLLAFLLLYIVADVFRSISLFQELPPLALPVMSHLHYPSSGHRYIGILTPSVRLAIVFSFSSHDQMSLLQSFSEWRDLGPPCKVLIDQDYSELVDLVFWFHRELSSEQVIFLQREVGKHLSFMRFCFRMTKFLSARLNDSEEGYPAGPSHQFYRLMLTTVANFTGQYDYMFWMEHDVAPIRDGWLDKVFLECLHPAEFFVKGSVFRGRSLDSMVRDPTHLLWIPHINGNAIYRLGNPQFVELVYGASRVYPPSHHPFDTAIWRAAANSKYNWPKFQDHAHLFIYSDFIVNYGHESSPYHHVLVRQHCPHTYFIHGSPFAAGAKKVQNSRSGMY